MGEIWVSVLIHMSTAALPTRHSETDRRTLRTAMGVSLVVGILMFVIKVSAYLLTGSAAILSDAAESVVHVAAVCFAVYSLRLSFRPADDEHLYGHTKISFFSAGFEGAMIILAALYIIYESIAKWREGLHLQHLGAGTWLTVATVIINGGLGGYLIWLGRQKGSIILVANGKHVLTDCWTSLGVVVGLVLTQLTGWLPCDPIFAILVASNILISGAGLVRRSIGGLMDAADPRTHRRLVELLEGESRKQGIGYHDLRHRNIGDAHWVQVHLQFPGETSIHEAHRIATVVEKTVKAALEPGSHIITHLEPFEDSAD